MDSSAVYQAIAQLGFPIFVAVYLLMRFDRLITTLTAAIQTEHAIIERLVTALERGKV